MEAEATMIRPRPMTRSAIASVAKRIGFPDPTILEEVAVERGVWTVIPERKTA